MMRRLGNATNANWVCENISSRLAVIYSPFSCRALWSRSAHDIGDRPKKSIMPIFDHFSFSSNKPIHQNFLFATGCSRYADSLLRLHGASQNFDALSLSPDLYLEIVLDNTNGCRRLSAGLFIPPGHHQNLQCRLFLCYLTGKPSTCISLNALFKAIASQVS